MSTIEEYYCVTIYDYILLALNLIVCSQISKPSNALTTYIITLPYESIVLN